MKKKGRVARALRLTRWGMVWERGARAFWPLLGLLACLFAIFALGGVAAIPAPALPWIGGAILVALLAAAIWGGLHYRRVRDFEAVERLDRTLPGRPLAALGDHAALGGEGALWRAHLAQMQARANAARAVRPDTDLARRDPFALRLAAMVVLVMALIFGGAGQMGQGISAIAATMGRPLADAPGGPSGPSWEGWAEPPRYTNRPTIYLNALREGEVLELPKGSAVTFRLYGEGGAVTQDIGPAVSDDAQAPGFRAEQSGAIEVAGRRFDVTVLADHAPVIRAGAAPTRRADGRLIQEFQAEDDHGVTQGHARIDLDLASVDRRFGLAVEPEPRDPVELQLPLPRGGDRREIAGQLVEDLARHPWANLPVTLTLEAVDGIEQVGLSQPMQTILPGKRFFNPMAAALIEMRRDLLWSRQNARRSAEILRAVTWQPDGFVDQTLYQELQGAVRTLEAGDLSEDARDALAEALWKAAMLLEDGGLSDALARMKQAQEKLSEAIRNGASPDEIQRLMDELKEATDAYTQMLAEQGQQDQSERFGQRQQGQQITGDQIQQMMDEIQRLMNEGRMAEAQQLLEQFNRMMENLQVTQGEGGEGQGQGQQGQGNQSMNRLADTLREQQRLSDEAFRDMQEQFGQGQQGQPSPNAGDMAERQRDLRQELGQQRGMLPGQGSPQGDEAQRQLDEAGRAMEDAEQALRDGDTGGALQRQADAIQSLREGMRALGDMMNQDGQRQAGEGQQEGQQQGGDQEGQGQQPGDGMRSDGRPMLDPLGRQRPGNGNVITSGDPLAEGLDPAKRARDLLDEIRRRSGERERPQDERDYLGRLLDRF